MKRILTLIALTFVVVLGTTSCEDFLNRPAEDSYTTAQFYLNDTQVEQGVNYLYNVAWYDNIRFFIYGSEKMCGNVWQDRDAYMTLTVNGTDGDLKNMAYSYWAENAQCNTVIHNILASTGDVSEAVRNRCIGEALAWKAMAYFFLVRTFGDVPIIHDNTEVIKEASYNEVSKVEKADVYEYAIMTLEKAMSLLPKNAYIGKLNRIDYYAAEALMAKIYLTKAGVTGTLNPDDLNKAKQYALDVIQNSGRTLTPKYSDIFRMTPAQFQQTGECLFTWHWQAADKNAWTTQNSIQCDVGMNGFSEEGDLWGGWKGPSVDLQDLFGVSALDDPTMRVNTDDRRQATMMMFGDQYDYFWTDCGGFDFYRFLYDDNYYPGGLSGNASSKEFTSLSGAVYAKHLFGDKADHVAALGYPSGYMYNGLPTHILRLADIYLVYAEACMLTGDASGALEYVNKVRERAHAKPLTEISVQEIWKERRRELALEGDNWYDLVRRSYYDVDGCIADLKAQRRSGWDGLDKVYKNFVTDNGTYVGPGAHGWDVSEVTYRANQELTDVKPSMFTMPFPTEDVVMNPNVGSTATPVHVDVRETYIYDF